MVNHEFNNYGYVEGSEFEGLMPKVMEKLGDEFVIGESDVVVSIFNPTAKGNDSMAVVDVTKLAEE